MSLNRLKKGVIIAGSGIVVTGTSFLSNSITGASSLNISGTTNLNSTTIRTTLNVSGVTSLQGAVTLSSTLSVSGNTNINGSFIVNGSSNQSQVVSNSSSGLASMYFTTPTASAYLGLGSSSFAGTNYAGNMFLQSPSNIVFNVNGNGGSVAPAMYIASSGNVGVGTTTPEAKLHIDGNCHFKNTSSWSVAKVIASGTMNSAIYMATPFGTISSSNPEWCIGQRGASQGPLSIWNYDGTTHNQNNLTLTYDGKLGIGTANPSCVLDIRASTGGWTDNPIFQVMGRTDFDGSNVVNFQCQASQYGRNILFMTGRDEAGNDAWSSASPRNAIIFRHQSSLNSAYTNRWTIQSFGGALGFLHPSYSTSSPVGMFTSTGLTVNGTSTLQGATTILSTLNVSGNTVIQGTLTVNGNSLVGYKQLASAPSNPNLGDEWYNTSTSVLYKYIGNNWVHTPSAIVDNSTYQNFTGSESIVNKYGWTAGETVTWTAPTNLTITGLTIQASGALNNGGNVKLQVYLNGVNIIDIWYQSTTFQNNVIDISGWSTKTLLAGQTMVINWYMLDGSRYFQARNISELPIIVSYSSNTNQVNLFNLVVTGNTTLRNATTLLSTLNVSGISKLGNAQITSSWGTDMSIAHASLGATVVNTFALYQGVSGDTVLNSAGTYPLAFKINNSEKMTLISSGNLGIGTTNPNTKLNILTGNGNFIAMETNNSTNNKNQKLVLGCMNNDLTGASATTSYSYIDSWMESVAYNTLSINPNGGNVGIGITSPSAKLHVSGDMIVGNGTGANSIFINDIPTARWRIGTGGYNLNFSKHTGTTTSDFSSWSQKMILDQNGNLGIGTTTPSSSYGGTIPNSKLSILSGTAGADGGTSRLSIGGDNSHYAAIEGKHTAGGATTLALMTSPGANVNSSNPLTRLFINSDGNVGIGTDAPTVKLDARTINLNATNGTNISTKYHIMVEQGTGGTFTGTFGGFMEGGCNYGFNHYLALGTIGYNNGITYQETMRISGSNNVGIGTTAPTSILHLARSVSAASDFNLMVSFENTISGYHDWMIGPQILNNAAFFSIRGGNADGFGSLSNNIFNINGNNGNIGIGNTNPSYKLHVTGDINFTGSLYQNGTLFVSGGGGSTTTTSSLTIGTVGFPSVNSPGTTTLVNYGNACLYRNRLIFSSGLTDWNHCIYNNGYNNDGEGAWDGIKINSYAGFWVRVGNAGNSVVPTTALYINNSANTTLTSSLNIQNESTDTDSRYDIHTFMKPFTQFLDNGGTISNLTYTTDSSSPVGTEVLQTSAYMWVNGPRIRLDRTKNYEVEFWLRRTTNGGTGGATYMIVAEFDSAGNNIGGDGAQWHYPINYPDPMNVTQSNLTLNTWYNYRYIVGPYGGSKNHSPTACYISLGFIVNYTTGTDTMQLTGFKLKPVPRYNNDSLTVTNSGNIGIGTTAPSQLLDITNASSQTPAIRLQSQFSACYLSVGSVLGVNSYIGLQSGVATSSALSTPTLVVTNGATVGIGTTNPGYKLHVVGDINFTGSLYQNGTIFTSGGGSTTTTSSLTIGTAALPSANSAGTTTLVNYGNACLYRNRLIFSSALTDWNHCIYNNYYNNDNEGQFDGFKINSFNGFWVRVGNANSVVPTTALYINSSANVGIGTTSPNIKLDISNAARSGTHGNSGNVALYVTSDGGAYSDGMAEFRHSNGTQGIGIGYNGIYATGSGTNQDINLVPRGTGNLIIRNGNVAIGAITPSHKLHIYDNIDGGVQHYTQNASAGASAYTLIGCMNNTPSQLVMFLNSSGRSGDGGPSTATVRNDAGDLRLQAYGGTNGLHIKGTSGNVGIGTTNATVPLQVGDPQSGSAWGSIYTSSSGSNYIVSNDGTRTVFMGCDTSGYGIVGTNSNHDFVLRSNNTERLRVYTSGVVDIKGNTGGGNWGATYASVNGTLVIGRNDTNYGGNSGTTGNNVAGLVMECLNNTEIGIHDAEERFVSFMYYSGNILYIGRNAGWGTTSTHFATDMTCAGDISAFSSASDIRLKRNVNILSSSLNIIKHLNPVTFTWKEDIFNEGYRGKDDVGFIAQEVEQVIPHAVGEFTVENNTYKKIKHERITPYIVKSVQELTTIVEDQIIENNMMKQNIIDLQNENDRLKTENQTIKEQLARLMAWATSQGMN